MALIAMLLGSVLYAFWKTRPAPSIMSSSSAPDFSKNLREGVYLRDDLKDVPSVPTGLFNYGGAFLFAALTASGLNAAITEAHPQFHLRYTEPINQNPGSGTGIAMLIDKQLSFSQSGRPLNPAEIQEAAARGYRLEAVPVALDGIAFYTHPAVPVRGLSIEQVQAIFTEKVNNWREVGGPDLPIVPISIDPKLTSSFQMLFEGKENTSIGATVRILRDYTACLRAVASTPGAISYGSSPLIVTQRSIKPIALSRGNSREYVSPVLDNYQVNTDAFRQGTYPLTRRLFVIIRRDGSLDEQAGIAYSNLLLSKQGQQIARKAGFVPIRF